MRKVRRKVATILVLIMILQVIISITNKVEATIESGSDTLLISSGVTITKNTTLDEVNTQYGSEAKLVTPSALGGNTYTYYKGDYEDILYVETDSENKIITVGAISDDFQSQLISYGETTDGTLHYMQGTFIDGWFDGATGVLVYNRNNLTSSKINEFYTEYMKNINEYQKYYCQHAVIMINHYLKKDNVTVMAEYDEDIFDTLAKIKKNGKDITTYAEENKKTSHIKKLGASTDTYTTYEMLPNPLEMVDRTRDYNTTQDKKYAFMAFDIYEDSNGWNGYSAKVDTYYVSEDFIKNTNTVVELTDEEKEKYNNAKTQYAQLVELFNKDGSTNIYEVEPVYETAPLTAGIVKQNKLEGTIGYVNAIRAGAGLPLYEHSSELSEYAQYKSTLVRYNSIKGYKSESAHYPIKPDEVSDEFYNKAQSGMGAENLYGGSNIISTITNALNDVYGDPVKCGHRYNILDPNLKYMGVGITDGQGTHKFSGYQSYSGNVVAWPSEGITPTQGFNGGRWTCMLTSKYAVTDNTTIKVVRLNDNKQWNFTEESTGSNFFAINGAILTFSNSDLTSEDGYVYQITINNLRNTTTNTVENYTYRSVFASVYGQGAIIEYPNSVSINQTAITGITGKKVEIDTTILSEDATEIALKWTSSDKNVAIVSQYGIVTLVNPGTATITVETLNGKKATCQVTVLDYVKGDVNQDGKVTIADVNLGLRKISKKTVTNDEHIKMDVTGDEKFTIADINKMLRYLSKKITEL